MRIKHSKTPLPKDWSTLGVADRAVLISDIRVCRRGRLVAKLIVFKSVSDLRMFWKKTLGKGELGKNTIGAVNSLSCEVNDFSGETEKRYIEADCRVFCVIGLVVGKINQEIVTHESTHAGFAYAKRVKNRFLWTGSLEMDEESVCYPAGRIAHGINQALLKLEGC